MPDTTPPTERPDWACVLCPVPSEGRFWRESDHGYRTCQKCLTKLRDVLSDIRAYYRRLDPSPGANLETGGRGSPGYGSKPGAQLHVVAMRDRRSKSHEVSRDAYIYEWVPDPAGWSPKLPEGVLGPLEAPGRYDKRDVWYGNDGRAHSEQTRPPRSVPGTLASIASMIAEDREMADPHGTVDHLVHWLDVQMEYVSRQGWIVDVDDDLRSLRAQIKPYAGDGRKNRILDCPNTIDHGEYSSSCGYPLYEPNRAGVIKCHACKREWPRDKWQGDGPEYLSQLGEDSRSKRAA